MPHHAGWLEPTAELRRRHPGAPCSLDALCKRYGIDLSEREKHGALLDCRLLAGVYVELVGGHQARLDFAINGAQAALLGANAEAIQPRPRPLAFCSSVCVTIPSSTNASCART